MSGTETEISYYVIYQKEGDTGWIVYDRGHKEWKQYTADDSTTDLAEAIATAEGLLTGAVVTDSRPQYQYKIAATQVIQRMHVGTTVITLGTPRRED